MFHLVRRVPRNASLLVTLIALIVVAPIVPVERSWFIVELLFDMILLAGVYSVGPTRHRSVFLVLTGITLATRWGELLSGAIGLDVSALALTVIWVCYAVSIIVVHLFQRRDVDVDAITGAVVVYLLVAVAFAMLFQLVEITRPGAFSGLEVTAADSRSEFSNSMIYYSLVCITTMGYGDIVPTGALARPLSVLEGVFGQLYLAVMIARLVGIHSARSRQNER